jgi:DNA polymerase III alpha subunit (gram-positive type)
MNKPHLYYIVFDFETGGFDSNKHPAAELAMIAIRGDNFEEIGRIDNIISPYDKKAQSVEYDMDSFLIQDIDKKAPKEEQDLIKETDALIESSFDYVYTKGAQGVHGLTQSDFQLSGIMVTSLVDKIIELSEKCKVSNFTKAVLVGHNPDFDRNFIQQIFDITKKLPILPKIFAGKEDHFGNFQPHMIDTIDLSKLMWHKNDEEIANYQLSTCAQKAKLDLVGSHRAINDVITTKELFLFFKKKLRANEATSDLIEESRDRDNFKFEY